MKGKSDLKVKSAKESDSPILKGKVFPTRQSNKGLYEDLVCDSGCTKTVVSKQISKDLDIQIKALSSNRLLPQYHRHSENVHF